MDYIIVTDVKQYSTAIHDLFFEYIDWASTVLYRNFGLHFSAEEIVKQDMLSLDKFMPSNGRLLLAFQADEPADIACLKYLSGDMGEIKRMYVRPQFRGRRVGKTLMLKLITEAQSIGYRCLMLDSARFMIEAHHLYRSMGFIEIGPYEGSEIQKDVQSYWIFMEKQLG